MLLSNFEKPSIDLIPNQTFPSFPSSPFLLLLLLLHPNPRFHLPSLSATTISTNEPPTELKHAHKNPRISIQLRRSPPVSEPRDFIFYFFIFGFLFIWRPISWLRSESRLILSFRPRGWVLRAQSSRRLSVTSSLKASATSALKILAILATVTASCRFAPCLRDAWCLYLQFCCSLF